MLQINSATQISPKSWCWKSLYWGWDEGVMVSFPQGSLLQFCKVVSQSWDGMVVPLRMRPAQLLQPSESLPVRNLFLFLLLYAQIPSVRLISCSLRTVVSMTELNPDQGRNQYTSQRGLYCYISNSITTFASVFNVTEIKSTIPSWLHMHKNMITMMPTLHP